ncbi:hypothetical protein OIO90_004118 [Microbotryomycetes sp. JL221]|nr:hypothetical protein OIO90_004118 [Microbotryomycetes sp. JL221]
MAKRNNTNNKSTRGKHNSQQNDDDHQSTKIQQTGSRHSNNQKKGKGKFVSMDQQDDLNNVVVEGEPLIEVRFGIKEVENEMLKTIDRLRVGLKNVVGRVGRVVPGLLDGLRVEMDGDKRPLLEFATVSVKDGRDLVVTCYDESYLKPVSQAIYTSQHNFAPQPISPTVLKVPVPKPNLETRRQLVKQTSDLCEQARVAVRGVRTKSHKDIKADIDDKLSSKDEGQKDGKKLDTMTKKYTDEIDKIFDQARKVLLDE